MKKSKIILWIFSFLPYILLVAAYTCDRPVSDYLGLCSLGAEIIFTVFLVYFYMIHMKKTFRRSLLSAICLLILYVVIFISTWIIWFKFVAKWEYRPGPTEQPMTITKPELRQFHIERIARGYRYYQIQIPENCKYNTFILFQKTFPDQLKICGNFFIPPESIHHVPAELYLKAIDHKDLKIFLRRGQTEGGWCMSQVLQKCTGTSYKEKEVQWGKFFFKTTTASDGKFKSDWDDLSEGETGFFIFPMFSTINLSPIELEKIKPSLNRSR